MEEWIHHWVSQMPALGLGVTIVFCLAALGKGADWLVDEAVALSVRAQIPKAIIGATIVSLGTTLPEAVISVLAAVKGSPGLALGNAVGSIICDTGLILGIAILIHPMPLDRNIVNRQGWLQLASGFLLIGACFPFTQPSLAFTQGGRLPQWMGFVFLFLLAAYLWQSIRWSKGMKAESEHSESTEDANPFAIVSKLCFAIGLVVLSSWILIPAVKEAAIRLHVPEGIIAATLVAFGTSLPELVTAVTAARRGHGELGLGNVIGADILNVLFVAGASAAVTPGGLLALPHFFKILFPAMLLILVVFRTGIFLSGERMKRSFGIVLLVVYAMASVASYLI